MSDENNNFDNQVSMHEDGAPRWVWLAMLALAAVSLVGLGVGWNATTHARAAEQSLANQTKAFQQNMDTLSQRLADSEQTNTQLRNDVQNINDNLKTTEGQVTSTRRQTSQIRDEYSKKLDSVQTELSAKASADSVASLGTDVNGVKTDLDAEKNNLQMARGELGTLIARNHDEIDTLRRMGERDYFEFTLSSKGQRSRVGNLQVELRGTNVKKNQFSLDLYVDDMRMEKKNRAADEPIYFYTRGTHAPMELVINTVGKDQVSGYLSEPKAQPAATTAASNNANTN
jgi:chromosome segregation ATPase